MQPRPGIQILRDTPHRGNFYSRKGIPTSAESRARQESERIHAILRAASRQYQLEGNLDNIPHLLQYDRQVRTGGGGNTKYESLDKSVSEANRVESKQMSSLRRRKKRKRRMRRERTRLDQDIISERADSVRSPPRIDLPIEILYKRFSWTPLEELNFYTWREKVTDSLLRYISLHCAFKLVRLSLHSSAGWSSKAGSNLLESSSHLVYVDFSDCDGCTDRVMASMSSRCPKITSLRVARCKQLSGRGLLAVAEGVFAQSLLELDVSGCSVASQQDGGRLFISAVCINCKSLAQWILRDARGLAPGVFEAALSSSGNILNETVATPKLPAIKVLDLAITSGSERPSAREGGIAADYLETKAAVAAGDKVRRSHELKRTTIGPSARDMELIFLSIHKQARNLDLTCCYCLTDDALSGLCNRRTGWGFVPHTGFMHLHTLLIEECPLISDVAITTVGDPTKPNFGFKLVTNGRST